MATKIAAAVFLLVGLAHLSRLLFQFNLVIGSWSPPLWVNGLAACFALGLSVWLWKGRG